MRIFPRAGLPARPAAPRAARAQARVPLQTRGPARLSAQTPSRLGFYESCGGDRRRVTAARAHTSAAEALPESPHAQRRRRKAFATTARRRTRGDCVAPRGEPARRAPPQPGSAPTRCRNASRQHGVCARRRASFRARACAAAARRRRSRAAARRARAPEARARSRERAQRRRRHRRDCARDAAVTRRRSVAPEGCAGLAQRHRKSVRLKRRRKALLARLRSAPTVGATTSLRRRGWRRRERNSASAGAQDAEHQTRATGCVPARGEGTTAQSE
jgi:hypothetical protein